MKQLFLLLFIALSVNVFGQGMRCPQCTPSPVGHAGEVLSTDGTFLEWAPAGGSIGAASNGLTERNDSVVLGGTLIENTQIVSDDYVLLLSNTGASKFLAFSPNNDPAYDVVNTGSITDSAITAITQSTIGVSMSVQATNSSIQLDTRVDTFRAVHELTYDGYRYQSGVFDNDGNKQNIDAEQSIYSYKGFDVAGVFVAHNRVDFFEVVDTAKAQERPDAFGRATKDSITMYYKTGTGLGAFQSKWKQDTAFAMVWDSGAAIRSAYYHSNAIYDLSNKEIGIGTSANVDLKFYHNRDFAGIINRSLGGTAIGIYSMSTCTGDNNTAFGYNAIGSTTSSDNNTAVGYVALSVVDGNDNTAIGFYAGGNNTTGSNNVYIGALTDGPAGMTNSIVLGHSAGADNDNQFVIGTQTHVKFPAATKITAPLSAFDDDADAGLGGLTAGDWYQTTGSGAAPLNVAGIVMIKQ